MVGGEKETFDALMPYFEIMGKTISFMGEAGAGQHTKAANQIVISGNMIGTVEGLLYAYKNGLDQNQLIDIIGTGAAASWNLNNLGRKIANNSYNFV